MYGWRELITHNLYHFYCCEDNEVLRQLKYGAVCADSFMKYMNRQTCWVEDKIRNVLPEKFVIIVDGWQRKCAHYVRIFTSFYSGLMPSGFEFVLPSMSPLEDETKKSTNGHVEKPKFVSQLSGKPLSNVVAIVGDNFTTHKLVAHKAGCGFLGATNHPFNLTV